MAVLTVTTSDDIVDAFDGETSLREALAIAEGTAGLDIIEFEEFLGAITLTGGALTITDDVLIDGAREDGGTQAISGNNASRVFEVESGEVTFTDINVFYGMSNDAGGGLHVGSAADVTVLNSSFDNNNAALGGAIANEGTLRIERSEFFSNGATLAGGAIDSSGTLSIVDSLIRDNSADSGGSTDAGGGINTDGTTIIANTLISNNTGSLGGGIFQSGGDLTLLGTTLHGNNGLLGGGLNLRDGDLQVISSTITGNQATLGGGGLYLEGGLQSPTLQNSIISGNLGGSGEAEIDGSTTGGATEPDLVGRNIIGSNGYLLDTTAYTGIAPTDIFFEVDANGSGLLGDNGGFASTVALNPFFTPANLLRAFGGNYGELFPQDLADIDGDGVTNEALPRDANGGYREQGGDIEIGAVEAGGLVVNTLSSGSADDGLLSLAEAVALAEANDGADTITFSATLLDNRQPGDPRLEIALTGELAITTDITILGDIDGDGRGDVRLDGQDSTRHFLVDATGDLSIDGLVLANGNSSGLSTLFGDGGAVGNEGSFTATNTSFEGNNGGAYGGAFYNAGGTADLGNVTFLNNSATTTGGAIDNEGTLTVVNGTFVGNTAGNNGGAIQNNSGDTATILHSTFTGNTATSGDGGGLYDNSNGGLTLESSIVTGNTAGNSSADNVGGTITQVGYNIIGGTLTLEGAYDSTVNTAQLFDGAASGVGVAADHGGPVQTVALGPAIYFGNAITQTDDLDLDRDGDTAEVVDIAANGEARAPGSGSDLGAHVNSTRLVVTTLSNDAFDMGSLTDEINDGGGLSLREALAIANTTVAEEEIVFAAELAGGTINTNGSTLLITSSLSIDGDIDGDGSADITIDNGGHTRVVDIDNANVGLNGLVITGGNADLGAGIHASDVLLTISNSQITGNSAIESGAGLYLTLSDTTITSSTISDNDLRRDGEARGAGIFNDDLLTIDNSTISGNTSATSEGKGAGLYNSGTADLINTTIYGNMTEAFFRDSANGSGGGIYNTGTLSLLQSTVTGNAVEAAFETVSYGGGIFQSETTGSTTLTNSIVSGNSAGGYGYVFNDDVTGAYAQSGTNIVGSQLLSAGQTPTAIDPGQIFAGGLADNGGDVQTVALLRGGAAIDVGDASLLPMNLANDARGEGFSRIVGPTDDGTELDLGAYEEQIPDQPSVATFDNFLRINEDGVSVTGAIAIDDPDAGDTPTFSGAIGTALDEDIGDLFVNHDGDTVIFELDAPTVQNLDAGDVQNVRYRVEADDGTQATITINVRGADDGTNFSETLNGSFIGDFIDGLRGADTINGFGGDDTLVGGTAGDTLNGGGGSDTASFQGSTIRNVADLQGLQTNVGDAAGDVYNSIENLEGGNFIDVLFGDQGANVISGGRGSDRVTGRAGDDTLDGGLGFDKLYGNAGVDVMTGGGGNDRFIYFQVSDTGVGSGNRDIITDFNASGSDRIEISRFDADETTGGNQTFQFISTSQFSDAGQLRFFQATAQGITVILGNTDNDAAAEFQIELQGLVDLEAGDFVL
ncbi:MAG: VCBS domain-containing protein [Pseudomonadota bacterium]